MNKKEYTCSAIKTEVHSDDVVSHRQWQDGDYDFVSALLESKVQSYQWVLARSITGPGVWQVIQNKINGKIFSIQVFKMNADGGFRLRYEATEYGGAEIIEPNLADLIAGLEK